MLTWVTPLCSSDAAVLPAGQPLLLQVFTYFGNQQEPNEPWLVGPIVANEAGEIQVGLETPAKKRSFLLAILNIARLEVHVSSPPLLCDRTARHSLPVQRMHQRFHLKYAFLLQMIADEGDGTECFLVDGLQFERGDMLPSLELQVLDVEDRSILV